MTELTITELVIRMGLATLFGSLIGYEREVKGESAGFRTHMLVCVGSAIIALIQVQTTNQVISMAQANPDLALNISPSFTRLIAQVVSGIGFLGAGAIIMTKKSVSGLATAASIWATAGIGIAVGMGYYPIAFTGIITIFLILASIKSLLGVPGGEKLMVRYMDKHTHHKIMDYFEKQGVGSFSTEYQIDIDLEVQRTVYIQRYTLNIPSTLSIFEIIETVGSFDSVIHVSSRKGV